MTETVPPCYGRSASALVVDHDGHVLLQLRAKPPYGWAPSAGHVEPGETPELTAAKELREELGLTAGELQLVLQGTFANA